MYPRKVGFFLVGDQNGAFNMVPLEQYPLESDEKGKSDSRGSNKKVAKPLANRYTFRNWWEAEVLGKPDQPRYRCYGFVLALSEQDAAVEYLKEKGDELDRLSGKYCLILAVVGKRFKSMGFLDNAQWDNEVMARAVSHSFKQGYPARIAELLNLDASQLPCLVLFNSPMEADFAIVPLNNEHYPTIAAISQRMKAIFKMVERSDDPVKTVQDTIDREERITKVAAVSKTAGKVIAAAVSFAGILFQVFPSPK
jgi:hypothetical protein